MNLNDDVVYRCLRLGPLHRDHPGRSRSLGPSPRSLIIIFSSIICLFAGNVAALESLFDISCQGPW